MSINAKNFQKDDPKAIKYLIDGRNYLAKSRDYAGAIRMFKKALKLGTTKAFKVLALDVMCDCAKELDDYERSTDFMEQLCEIDLSFDRAFKLMTLYNATNNMVKRRAFAEKIRKVESDNDDNNRTLSTLLLQCEDYDEVLERGKKWLENHPDDFQVCRNILSVYSKQTRYEEHFDFLNNLIDRGFEDEFLFELSCFYGDLFDSEKAFEYLMKHIDKNKKNAATYKSLLGTLLVKSSYDGLLSDDEYIGYMNELMELSKPAQENTEFSINTDYFRKIRVGLMSYDFRNHSVGKFVMSVFDEISNNSGIETYCYYTFPDYEDEYTAVIKERANVFRSVGKYSDSQLRRVFLDDKLDVLVDLGGNTAGNKLALMAERFAPIQMSWIGFPMSTFTHNIDYQIGDPYLDPKDNRTEKFLTEKVIRMKHCFLCFALDMETFPPADEPPCVKNGYITFGNLSNPQKMSAKTLKLWKSVLDKVENSKLLIRFNAPKNEFFMNNFKARLKRHGLDLERVVFGEKRELSGYFDTYNDIDIMLDTYPFCAWTSMSESFFMGVPTLTYKGSQRQGRGWTLTAQVGLERFGADDDEDFAQKAFDLANDVEQLRRIKKTLRNSLKDSPLFDRKIYREDFENVIRLAYLRYCFKNKKPFDEARYLIDTDSLMRDCIRAESVIEYMLDETTPEHIELLTAEYLETAKLLLEALINKYEDQNSALAFIQGIMNALSALEQAKTGFVAVAVVKTVNKMFMRFAKER